MGYLELSGGIGNFSRAIISFWFRIPTATFSVMSAISDDLDPETSQSDHMVSSCYNPPLFKIIPLIVFGSVETDTSANPVQPSFIGIDCVFDHTTLACNLQTPVNGSVSGVDAAGAPRPGCFYMAGFSNFTPGPTDTTIAPDVWHHALISFDISGSETATYHENTGDEPPPSFGGTSTFSWALDDVSKVGPSMSPSGGGAITGLADNIIVTNWIVDATADLSENDLFVSFSGGHIASSGNPVGIPVSASFVANNQVVEFGPLQIFTDISADATDSVIRRLFVTADGKPATATSAQASLGQAPIIRFDTLADWRTGTNKGSGGNFATTGAIEAFTPGPDLTP